MDATEARTRLDAADAKNQVGDFDGAYEDINEAFDAGEFEGESRGRAAVVLGVACYGSDSLDAAHQYLTEALTNGSSEEQATAREYLGYIENVDDAVDASEGGYDQGETDATLRTADETYENGNADRAFEIYSEVLQQGHGQTSEQAAWAAYGLARCYLRAGDHAQAGEYLDLANGHSATPFADERAAMATRLERIAAGEQAASDGTQVGDYNEYFDAGNAANAANDFDTAIAYFQAIYEAEAMGGSARGTAALGLALAYVGNGDYATARQFFDFGRATGFTSGNNDDVIAKLVDILDKVEAGQALDAVPVMAVDAPPADAPPADADA